MSNEVREPARRARCISAPGGKSAWLRCRAGLTNICVGGEPRALEQLDDRNASAHRHRSRQHVRDRFADARFVTRPQFLARLRSSEVGGCRWLLIAGDAAGFVDPMTATVCGSRCGRRAGSGGGRSR